MRKHTHNSTWSTWGATHETCEVHRKQCLNRLWTSTLLKLQLWGFSYSAISCHLQLPSVYQAHHKEFFLPFKPGSAECYVLVLDCKQTCAQYLVAIISCVSQIWISHFEVGNVINYALNFSILFVNLHLLKRSKVRVYSKRLVSLAMYHWYNVALVPHGTSANADILYRCQHWHVFQNSSNVWTIPTSSINILLQLFRIDLVKNQSSTHAPFYCVPRFRLKW